MEKNAALLFGIHGSIKDIGIKTKMNFERVNEFLVLKKISKKHDKVYVFSHDNKIQNMSILNQERIINILLYNQLFYVIFGWIFLFYYIKRRNIDLVYLECSAIPLIFLINKITKAKVLLNYNYLLFKVYSAEENPTSIKNRITKSGPISAIVKIYEKIMVRFADYIIVASKEIEEFVPKEKIINDRIGIKKGIITDMFNPDYVKKHKIYEKIRGPSILFTSRLTAMKNPLLLISAYKIAKKEIPNLNLIIAGDGDLLMKCKSVSDDNVHFLGFVDEIPSLLKGADVFVIPSNYDPSPRSLMEAMSMGVPSIATNAGGMPDYLDDSCGVLVEPRNPKELAEKIIFLIKNKKTARRLGKNARKKILEYHDLNKNFDKILNFLETVH